MATLTPIVLIISSDPEVKQVSSALTADGLAARAVSSPRELQRALTSAKGRCVAVFDAELAADPSAQAMDMLEKLRTIPVLVLLGTDSEAISLADPQRSSPEEFVRKPLPPSVLALRVKALILTAGLSLPSASPAPAPSQGPLAMSDDSTGQLTVVFSVKGGSGKSTIASNLAVGLASLYSLETLLVDANLWFGDLGVLLNLTSSRSSFDVSTSDDPDLFALPKAV